MAQTSPRARVVESIVPWLTYNPSCSSEVELRNLGSRDVDADVEAHKSSGALVALVGHGGIRVHLPAGENAVYKLQIEEQTDGAWVRVRETIPSPELSPVLAVSGATDCVAGDKVHTTARDVAWPLRNPFFSGDVKAGDDGTIALINASERPVPVSGCYSSGTLYSRPDEGRPGELRPVCSEVIRELVPPFGTRQFTVSRGGNSHFSLNTRGESIVLEMLRPAEAGSKIYRVDSSISFGEEAPAQNPRP